MNDNQESKQLYLFLVKRTDDVPNFAYESFIVACANEADAITWHPNGDTVSLYGVSFWLSKTQSCTVEKIGIALPHVPEGVIHASFTCEQPL